MPTEIQIDNIISNSGNFASGLNIANQTANSIMAFDSNKNAISLSTSTYPSLTELSYLKGITSSIQSQINSKSSTSHTHTSSDITNFNSSVSGLVSGVYAPLTGKLNQFASTTSAELLSVISDETGSGTLVCNTNPVFSGSITAPSGNFTNNLQVGSNNLTANDILNIINSTNIYLWSNFR